MAAKQKAARAGQAAKAAQNNPYIHRLIEDDELRDNLRAAFDSSRSVYGRLANGKQPAKALLDDKKVQKELREVASSLKDASDALRDAPRHARKKRSGHLGRKLFVLMVAAGLALALSESLRSKVLDMLFGAEEEFDYTSTPPAAPPAADASA